MSNRSKLPFFEILENLFETNKSPNGARVLKKFLIPSSVSANKPLTGY